MYILYNAGMPSHHIKDFVARERAIDLALGAPAAGSGVSWAGLSAPAPSPRDEVQLLKAASAKAARQAAWLSSPEGTLISAVAQAQQACEDALALGERARSAMARGEPPSSCRELACELSERLRAALRHARRMRRISHA